MKIRRRIDEAKMNIEDLYVGSPPPVMGYLHRGHCTSFLDHRSI